MQCFREKRLLGKMSALTALIFLNMGFFLWEVKVLGLETQRHLMENISKMMAGAPFEEERDCNSQSSTQNFAEEEYLPGHQSASHCGCYFLIAEHTSIMFNGGGLEKGYYKNFCPPPEI